MVNPEQVLAIVPARGGSKSIPRKNIELFAGHPLLSYSIAAGLQAQSVGRLIVSTDDEEIARVARSYGAEVPFLRPAALAQDETLDLPVFLHAIEWLAAEQDYHPQVVIQLRPTSPLRPPGLIDRAVMTLLDHDKADSVRGVVPSGQNPYKMWRLTSRGEIAPLLRDGFEEPYNMPRQKLPQTYWQTGHVDAIRVGAILEKGSMSGSSIFPVMIDPRYSVDIDTPQDWARAEWLVEQGELDLVLPGRVHRQLPAGIEMVVLDFDGVLTDNRVWVDSEGIEMVAAHRGDGWGISQLKQAGIEVIILSTESDPVVTARAKKLGVPVLQGVKHKERKLVEFFKEQKISGAKVIYVGNDVNDLGCFPLVGCAVAVSDAHPEVRRQADRILSTPGGYGAVRELCDLILASRIER